MQSGEVFDKLFPSQFMYRLKFILRVHVIFQVGCRKWAWNVHDLWVLVSSVSPLPVAGRWSVISCYGPGLDLTSVMGNRIWLLWTDFNTLEIFNCFYKHISEEKDIEVIYSKLTILTFVHFRSQMMVISIYIWKLLQLGILVSLYPSTCLPICQSVDGIISTL